MGPLGDRMKMYEGMGDKPLNPILPVMVRLDGKAFHSFTRSLERPYDERLSDLMVATTKFLVDQSNAIIGYTQSDEISLVLYSDSVESEIFMGGRDFKLKSLLASYASVYFNSKLAEFLPEKVGTMPVFDCRVWNVPNKVEAVNALVWREQDATRNSVSMAAQSVYSHNQLMNVSCDQMKEMLHQKGINWNDYPVFFKRGTYIQRHKVVRPFSVEEMEKLDLKTAGADLGDQFAHGNQGRIR